MKLCKDAMLLLAICLLAACTPNVSSVPAATPTVAVPGSSPAETLSKIIWASDPSRAEYDPGSAEYAEFPSVVKQISGMGINAADAADDLAVAIRYPRQDAYLAAQALLKLGPDLTAITAGLLIDNLKDEKPETRIYSAILLASVGRRASCAVEDIGPLLGDADPYVRSAAALALERLIEKDLVPGEYQLSITSDFLARSISPDDPEGRVVDAARTWWNEEGSKVNWHPSYGLCDP